MRWKNSILERTGPWAWFFLLYAVWGFFTLDDFGVHLDEMTQRTIGMENNRFLSGRVGFDKVEQHKFFGPIWESVSYLAEQVVFTEPLRTKLLLRRALLWSFFVFGLWRLYLMGLRNNGWGMIGWGMVEKEGGMGSLSRMRLGAMLPVLMVALWPRMFAEAHYNTKDALFFVLVLLVVDGLERVWSRGLKRWDWGWFGVMGLLGVATTIRMGGVFVLGLAMVWPLAKAVKHSSENLWTLSRWLLWGVLAFAVGYIGSYPYLWFTGFDGLKQVLGFVFENPWPHGALFFGSMEPSRWYLPGWMITTLSGLILVPLLFGGSLLLIETLHGKRRFAFNTVNFLLCLLLLYLGFVMVKKPVMYDAWRHSLFLLLPVVVLSARGWVTLWFWALHSSLKRKALTFLTGIGLIQGLFWVVPNPFIALLYDLNRANEHTELGYESGQTYFNGLGKQLIKRYPMQIDYWHQTNYQALEWVGKQLPVDASALVIGKGESLMLNAMLLPSALQWRIHTVTPEFLDSTVTLASMNAIWPEVNAKLKEIPPKTSSNLTMSNERIPPIKQVYWIAFGDELQLKEPLEPTMHGVVSWELDQEVYREKLPLLRIYRAVFNPVQ
ncbi:MAG: hypothetical protein ACO27G_02155 [Bacteroidia bacterium]